MLACAAARDGFDARRDARSRTYCYRVLARRAPSPFERRRALWWPHRVDPEALRACAGALIGTHDFTAFTPTQTDHVRFERDVLDARWETAGDVLEFWITADTFMRHMNRVLVGTMLEVASGRRSLESFAALLSGRPRPRRATPRRRTGCTSPRWRTDGRRGTMILLRIVGHREESDGRGSSPRRRHRAAVRAAGLG